MAVNAEAGLLPEVTRELEKFSGQTAYFDPLQGNNGDRLIVWGSERALSQARVKLTASPDRAQVIFINGGGAMVDFSQFGFEKFRHYLNRFPDTPLLVLPQSYRFEHFDFESLLANRRSPLLLYARERISLNLLQRMNFPPSVKLGIDHDMAFQLRDSRYMRGLRDKSRSKHVLIVERGDVESPTGMRHRPFQFALKQYVPHAIKQPLKRMIMMRRARREALKSPFARERLQKMLIDYPDFSKLPVFAADISDPGICGMQRFIKVINDAAVIITNRLHVAILGSMLNKPTYISEGSYHKMRGIYEYSLSSLPNVRLI